MEFVDLVCSCVVIVVVLLIVVVVVCVDLLILSVDAVTVEAVAVVLVAAETVVVVLLLVYCATTFVVDVFVVVEIFLDCGDFLHLCVDLSCFVGWRFCTEALVVVVDSVLVLDCVGLVV